MQKTYCDKCALFIPEDEILTVNLQVTPKGKKVKQLYITQQNSALVMAFHLKESEICLNCLRKMIEIFKLKEVK